MRYVVGFGGFDEQFVGRTFPDDMPVAEIWAMAEKSFRDEIGGVTLYVQVPKPDVSAVVVGHGAAALSDEEIRRREDAELAALPRINTEDAPSCKTCGAFMLRSGSCYKCANCGSTTGCT